MGFSRVALEPVALTKVIGAAPMLTTTSVAELVLLVSPSVYSVQLPPMRAFIARLAVTSLEFFSKFAAHGNA
jgi:hypothetical protein